MTDQIDDGRDTERGLTLTLNERFVERLGPQGVRDYVEAVVSTARDGQGRGLDVVTELLRERLDAIGVDLPDYSYGLTAEQLLRATDGELAIMLDDGTVLYGVARQVPKDPAVLGTDDPESPDRPTYT